MGDLGNIKTNEKGIGYLAISVGDLKMHGDYSIIGRSCVVHENEDDLGMGNHSDS